MFCFIFFSIDNYIKKLNGLMCGNYLMIKCRVHIEIVLN